MRGLLSLMLAIPLVVGCGDDGGADKLDCGDGTHLEDGTCVADEDTATDAHVLAIIWSQPLGMDQATMVMVQATWSRHPEIGVMTAKCTTAV